MSELVGGTLHIDAQRLLVICSTSECSCILLGFTGSGTSHAKDVADVRHPVFLCPVASETNTKVSQYCSTRCSKSKLAEALKLCKTGVGRIRKICTNSFTWSSISELNDQHVKKSSIKINSFNPSMGGLRVSMDDNFETYLKS